MFRKYYLLIILLGYTNLAFSQVRLPSVLRDNMVLQQNAKVKLWGKAKKSATLKVITSWDGKSYLADIGNAGTWEVFVKTPKGGGPYTISFDDGEKIVLNNILIGEVWLCSGQSNMEMPLKGFYDRRFGYQPVLKSDSIIENSSNNNLRIYKLKRKSSPQPLWDSEGDWKIANSVDAPEFSAVAFQYGQMLQEKLRVPVGIIVASWGGTPIQAWMGESMEDFEKETEFSAGKKISSSSSVLFNGMIKPLTNYTIRGFIWYQGENDRFKPESYKDKMLAMVKEWRSVWNLGKLPFYFVQIAPWKYNEKGKSFVPQLREAQLEASQAIANAEMVVTLDIGSEVTIHPPDKTTVAKRLLGCALNGVYGKDVKFRGPEYIAMKVNGNKALLEFKYYSQLVLKNKESENFEIAGPDKVFHKANVAISASGLEVWSADVNKPIAVRYGFKEYLVGDLFNSDGFPVSPFRTDKWPITSDLQ